MLILELLRHGLTGDAAVRAGRQMEMKERLMVEGITELGECSVGLIGFGDIAKAAAARLHPFGCELFYYAPHRKDPKPSWNTMFPIWSWRSWPRAATSRAFIRL